MSNTENDLPEGVQRDPIRPEFEDQPDAVAWDEAEARRRADLEDETANVGDRAISPVGSRLANSKGMKMAGVAAMVVVGGLVIAMNLGGDDKPKKEKETGPAEQIVAYEAAKGPAPEVPSLDGDAQDRAEAEAMLLAGQSPASASASTDGRKAEVDPAIQKRYDAQRAPVMARAGNSFSGMGGMGGGQNADAGNGNGNGGGQTGVVSALLRGAGGQNGEASELDQLRQGSAIGQSRARMLPNRNYLLTAGTQIPCILQTAMDTSTPGFVSCLISQDVYSDNGNVVLMERGTRVLGEYRGGLKRGQNRMFVLWNRAVTPKGVSINLASPAADTLGRAGMSGQVETFFWERFGGALLLSVVDDAVAVAANRYDDARNTVRQPSDAASVALENSVNIAPVLRKNQGTEVSIFAANDFDFSGVYRLALR